MLPAMCNSRALVLLALLLQSLVALVSAQGSNATAQWQTLSGDAPLVIAHGGFSGLFPDSSYAAYSLALITSLPNVQLWCDVQLTKDEAGICFRDLRLDNSSSITNQFEKGQKEYPVNGVRTKGWFAVDYTLKQLADVVVTQGVYSRTNKFDGNLYSFLTIDDVATQFKPPGLWLNVQHDIFYNQHNLSMRNFIISASRRVVISYISSPEVGFLRSIKGRISPKTKLVFRFLTQDEIEPSTNQTYGSLLKNLTFIKTFASGILVPKFYIWPEVNLYLEPQTSLVSDAHKEKLEVFASEFMNDYPLSYNYSYDPIAEYLNFIETGGFSVDGVLSDFPITPSEAIDCFAHLGKNARGQAKPLVISQYGASGDYPSCTNLAYENAIADGVDVIDCPVQMSKDGTPFCFSSINLIDSTTVAQSPFSSRTRSIPQIKAGTGIFTFSLTWDEIQTLTPSISSPFSDFTLFRNPRNKNSGKFLTLSEFLNMTKNVSSLSVLISIEHAGYLAEEQNLGVTDAVLSALSKASFAEQKVFIQSSNSSVLAKFQGKENYKLVYRIEEKISDIDASSLDDIKKFASSVVVNKDSVFPETELFLTGTTNVVKKLQSSNLSVYVETFNNEFVSQPWDFFSDATVEINSYVMGANIDGVITPFPKTAARYKSKKPMLRSWLQDTCLHESCST
nr:glycerophosphodiester phosphodiesterase GDPDL3-like isoform X2 [Ziziphus jujuba var. spinosa]